MKTLVVAVVFCLISACGSKKFNAATDKASEDPSDVTQVEVDQKKDRTSDLQCEKDSVTKATLLTKEIVNDSKDQFLHYKISVDNCDGEPLNIDGKTLLFDIDVVLEIAAIDYQVIVDGEVFNGDADPIGGRDLFGRTGANYAFYETRAVPTGKKTTEIEFKMDISYRDMRPIDGGDLLHTYFRVGEAKAVEKSVPFIR